MTVHQIYIPPRLHRPRTSRMLFAVAAGVALVGSIVTPSPANALSQAPIPATAATEAPQSPPVKTGGDSAVRLAGDCDASSLEAKAAKAEPVSPDDPVQVACLTVNDRQLSSAAKKARDAAIAQARAAAPAALTAAARAKALSADEASAPGVQEYVELPEWCYGHAFDGWWGLRKENCQIADIGIYIFLIADAQPPRLIGTARALEYDFAYTSDSIDLFAQQIRVVKYWGERVGNAEWGSIFGFSWCEGDCKPFSETGIRPGEFRRDVNNDGEAYYEPTDVAPGAIGYSHTHWQWWVDIFPAEPSTPRQVDPPQVRCDNAFADDGNVLGDQTPSGTVTPQDVIGAGCVFPGYTPVWMLSKSGLYPTVAQHMEAAQNSGLPGKYPDGQVLTRLQDSAQRRQNGDTACPPSPTWVRPPDRNCDEYPPRSTYQGAFTQGPDGSARTFAPPDTTWCAMDPAWNVPTGVTGPTGWSSCMLPPADNSSAGSRLGSFYRGNRVLDRDPFLVQIIP
jgi:hypothetical protein